MRRKILLLLIFIAVAGIDCFAETRVRYGEVPNGSVKIEEKDSLTRFEFVPGEAYALSDIRLIDEDGKSVPLKKLDSLHFEAELSDDRTYSLSYGFRRAYVRISSNELAMRTGESKRIFAFLEYADGDIAARKKVLDSSVSFVSSNPDVVAVSEDGRLTALKQGFSRITAMANASGSLSKSCWVVVDGFEGEKVAKMSLVSHFNWKDFFEKGDLGHSFILLESLSDKLVIPNADKYCMIFEPTKAYYDALLWDGEGEDPLTSNITKEAEESLTGQLKVLYQPCTREFFKEIEAKDLTNNEFVIEKGMIASIGADVPNLDYFYSDFLNDGDSGAVLKKYGFDVKSFEELFAIDWNKENKKNFALAINELLYDLTIDYSPFTAGEPEYGGMSINYELRNQVKADSTIDNAVIEMAITQTQLEAMLDYFLYDNHYNLAGRNCTQTATDVWNIVSSARRELHIEPNMGVLKGIGYLPSTQHNIFEKLFVSLLDPSITVYIMHPAFRANTAAMSLE